MAAAVFTSSTSTVSFFTCSINSFRSLSAFASCSQVLWNSSTHNHNHNQCLSYLVTDACERWLRSTESRTCIATRTHSTFGDRALAAAGPELWNSLPPHLRDADLPYSWFRRSLKTFLFGYWGHGAVQTILTAPSRNNRTYLLTYSTVLQPKQHSSSAIRYQFPLIHDISKGTWSNASQLVPPYRNAYQSPSLTYLLTITAEVHLIQQTDRHIIQHCNDTVMPFVTRLWNGVKHKFNSRLNANIPNTNQLG